VDVTTVLIANAACKAPAFSETEAGTDTRDGFELVSCTTAGPGPFILIVPDTEAPPPTCEGTLRDCTSSAATERLADFTDPPEEAEIAAVTPEEVCAVAIGKRAKLPPPGIVTDDGGIATGFELLTVTDMSCDDRSVRVTSLAVVVMPPTTAAGLRTRVEMPIARIVKAAVAVSPPAWAVMVTVDGRAADVTVIGNDTDAAPWGTNTEAGSATSGLEEDRVTVEPPAGAETERITRLDGYVFPGTAVAGANTRVKLVPAGEPERSTFCEV